MKAASSSDTAVERVLAMAGAKPVLLEVGPRGRPAPIWDSIASSSIYVGVGFEAEQMRTRCSHFGAVHLVNQVVIPTQRANPITFYVTQDPIYSGVLEPFSGCTEYLDSAARLSRQMTCSAVTIDSVLQAWGGDRFDWFHTNVSGIDLRLFDNCNERLQTQVLAIDTVFDIVDLWNERGSRLSAFDELLARGFWLSGLGSHGFVKMRSSTLARVRQSDAEINEDLLNRRHRVSPGWLFARFHRTISFLADSEASRQDHVKLWSFALEDRQFGFAADVACEYERRFGQDPVSSAMMEEAHRRLRRLAGKEPPLGFLRRLLPAGLRRRIRALVFGDI